MVEIGICERCAPENKSIFPAVAELGVDFYRFL